MSRHPASLSGEIPKKLYLYTLGITFSIVGIVASLVCIIIIVGLTLEATKPCEANQIVLFCGAQSQDAFFNPYTFGLVLLIISLVVVIRKLVRRRKDLLDGVKK